MCILHSSCLTQLFSCSSVRVVFLIEGLLSGLQCNKISFLLQNLLESKVIIRKLYFKNYWIYFSFMLSLVFVLMFRLTQMNYRETWHSHETYTAWHCNNSKNLYCISCCVRMFMYFDWCLKVWQKKVLAKLLTCDWRWLLPFFLSLLHDLLFVVYIAWNKSVIAVRVHLLATYYCKAPLFVCFICMLVSVLFTLHLFCLLMY
jgi:hypothetical protein